MQIEPTGICHILPHNNHHQIEMQSHKRVKNKSLLYQLQIMRALNDLRT